MRTLSQLKYVDVLKQKTVSAPYVFLSFGEGFGFVHVGFVCASGPKNRFTLYPIPHKEQFAGPKDQRRVRYLERKKEGLRPFLSFDSFLSFTRVVGADFHRCVGIKKRWQ